MRRPTLPFRSGPSAGPRRIPVLLVAATLTGLLAGCGSTTNPTVAPSSAAATASFHATAGGVTLAQRPTHIVSLTPTGTEMLFAIGAGQQVTAVDDQSDYPADAPKTNLSGYQPNAEAIAAKNPDLVVISDDSSKIKNQLTALKIPVYQMPAAASLDDTYRQLSDLGTLTGHASAAADEAKQIKDGVAKLVAEVPKRAKPLTYYYELDQTFYSVTSKTFIGSLFTMAGLQNVADPADADGKAGGYPQLTAESIVKANPDLIFLADTKCCQQSADTVKARAGWSGITAVQKGQVVALDDDIASRWGPRVVDLIKAITDAVAKVPTT
jgi:iron complex transport system substrate-binding protein